MAVLKRRLGPKYGILLREFSRSILASLVFKNSTRTQGAMASDPRNLAGVQNQDHSAVYVAWDKYPDFDTRARPFRNVGTLYIPVC